MCTSKAFSMPSLGSLGDAFARCSFGRSFWRTYETQSPTTFSVAATVDWPVFLRGLLPSWFFKHALFVCPDMNRSVRVPQIEDTPPTSAHFCLMGFPLQRPESQGGSNISVPLPLIGTPEGDREHCDTGLRRLTLARGARDRTNIHRQMSNRNRLTG